MNRIKRHVPVGPPWLYYPGILTLPGTGGSRVPDFRKENQGTVFFKKEPKSNGFSVGKSALVVKCNLVTSTAWKPRQYLS
jgi:hypothetical protein